MKRNIVFLFLLFTFCTVFAISYQHITDNVIPSYLFGRNMLFGKSLSVSGDYAIIGASYYTYSFKMVNGQWVEHQQLRPSFVEDDDDFGNSADFTGEYAVVGIIHDDVQGVENAGSAQVYHLENNVWVEDTLLIASNFSYRSNFGEQVSISDNYIAVSAIYNEVNGGRGRVYVFQNINGEWVEEAILTPSVNERYTQFGRRIHISGDDMIIGATDASYIFHKENGVWSEQLRLPVRSNCLMLSDGKAYIGNYNVDSFNVGSSSIDIYQRQNGVWTLEESITPPDQYTWYFGWSFYISGDNLLVSCEDRSNDSFYFSGDFSCGSERRTNTAYLYQKENGAWVEKTVYTNPYITDGYSNTYIPVVTMRGDDILIGEYSKGENSHLSGIVYYTNINDSTQNILHYPRTIGLYDNTLYHFPENAASIKYIESFPNEGVHDGCTSYTIDAIKYDFAAPEWGLPPYVDHFADQYWYIKSTMIYRFFDVTLDVSDICTPQNIQDVHFLMRRWKGSDLEYVEAFPNATLEYNFPYITIRNVVADREFIPVFLSDVNPPANQQQHVPADDTSEIPFDDVAIRLQFRDNHAETTLDLTQNFREPNVIGELPSSAENLADNYWQVESSAGNVGSYDITFDLSDVAGIDNFNTLKFLKREDENSPWQDVVEDLGATLVYNYPYITIQGLNGFSEFVPAGGNDNSLPVTLSSFKAIQSTDKNVLIEWSTASETEMNGFNVYRNFENNQTDALMVNSQIIGSDNTSSGSDYSISDFDVDYNNTYYYWLESVSLSGNSNFYGPVRVTVEKEKDEETPEEFTKLGIQGIYPNPFNPETNIDYSVKEETPVSIAVYNLKGQRVKTLVDKAVSAGDHKVVWHGDSDSGKSVSSGVYFVKMITGNHIETRKIVLMK